MQVGNVWLVLDNRGSNIQLKGVTPAECLILSHNDQALNEAKLQSHQINAGKFPLHDLEITGEAFSLVKNEDEMWVNRLVDKKPVARTDAEEIRRLEQKGYNKKMLGMAFPGLNPKLPSSFSEVTGWRAEDQKVVDAKAPKVEVTKPEEAKTSKQILMEMPDVALLEVVKEYKVIVPPNTSKEVTVDLILKTAGYKA